MSNLQTPHGMMSWLSRYGLALLLVSVAVKQAVLISTIPSWQTADEPAHFQYVQTLVEEGRLPVYRPNRMDFSREVLLSNERIDEQLFAKYGAGVLTKDIYPLDTGLPLRLSAGPGQTPINFAAPYGPVYYALAAGPYLLTRSATVETRLLAIRLLSSTFLLLSVWLTYRIVRRLRRDKAVALTVATLVGFFPMLGVISAGVNNDSFLLLLATLVFDRVSRWWQTLPGRRELLQAGLLAGLAAMTKQMGLVMVAIGAAAIWSLFRRERLTHRLNQLGWFAIPAIMIGLSWTIRGLFVDPNNFLSAENITPTSGQQDFFTPLWIFIFDLSIRFMQVWVTAWGDFGEFARYPQLVYGLLAVVVVAAGTGLVFLWRRPSNRTAWKSFLGLSVVGYLMLEAGYQLLYWHRALVHHSLRFPNQGRYYFLLMVPLMALLASGLEQLVDRPRSKQLVRMTLCGLMIGLTIWGIQITHHEYLGIG